MKFPRRLSSSEMEVLLKFSGIEEDYDVLIVETRRYAKVFFVGKEVDRYDPAIRTVYALYWRNKSWRDWVLQNPSPPSYPYERRIEYHELSNRDP